MDNKSTHFAVHVFPSIFVIINILSHYIQNPFKNPQGYIYIYIYLFNSQYFQRNVHHHFISFSGFGSNSQKYLSLCRALIFLFFLVHTQVIQVSNQCIIIYTMNNNHFTWTSFFNCLIGILSVNKFELSMYQPGWSYLDIRVFQIPTYGNTNYKININK